MTIAVSINFRMKAENFNLAWKDFESCTSNSFRGFLSRQEFVDVTLACDDERQIKAHKVILSACSDFFKNILLRNNDQKHPIIFIDNITYEELQNVVSFMYFGETALTQEDFKNFMSVAQKLKVRGLSEQYCKEVPVQLARKRGPRSSKRKRPLKKEEPAENVKYLNVVDALSKSIDLLETSEEEEEEVGTLVDNSVFLEVDKETKDDEKEEDEGLKEDVNENEDVEDGDDEEEGEPDSQAESENIVDNSDDDCESNDEYLPNENEEFSESEDSESEEDEDDDIEGRIELENIMEHINEDDDYTTENMEEETNQIKIEATPIEERQIVAIPQSVRSRRRQKRKRMI